MEQPSLTLDISRLATSALQSAGYTVQHFSSIESTNTEAKSRFGRTEILVAAHQTAGRGRYERTWQDAGQGRALLMSYSRYVQFHPQPILAPLVGSAVASSVARAFGVAVALKPPNDIYLEQKKLAGILIESVQKPEGVQLIIGLGINVLARPEPPPGEEYPATALNDHAEVNAEVFSSFAVDLARRLDDLTWEQRAKLSRSDQAEILQFLRRYTPVDINKSYLDIDVFGSLKLRSGELIPWYEL